MAISTTDIGTVVDTGQIYRIVTIEVVDRTYTFMTGVNWHASTSIAAVGVFAMINARSEFVAVNIEIVVITEALVAFLCQGALTVTTADIGAVVNAS